MTTLASETAAGVDMALADLEETCLRFFAGQIQESPMLRNQDIRTLIRKGLMAFSLPHSNMSSGMLDGQKFEVTGAGLAWLAAHPLPEIVLNVVQEECLRMFGQRRVLGVTESRWSHLTICTLEAHGLLEGGEKHGHAYGTKAISKAGDAWLAVHTLSRIVAIEGVSPARRAELSNTEEACLRWIFDGARLDAWGIASIEIGTIQKLVERGLADARGSMSTLMISANGLDWLRTKDAEPPTKEEAQALRYLASLPGQSMAGQHLHLDTISYKGFAERLGVTYPNHYTITEKGLAWLRGEQPSPPRPLPTEPVSRTSGGRSDGRDRGACAGRTRARAGVATAPSGGGTCGPWPRPRTAP